MPKLIWPLLIVYLTRHWALWLIRPTYLSGNEAGLKVQIKHKNLDEYKLKQKIKHVKGRVTGRYGILAGQGGVINCVACVTLTLLEKKKNWKKERLLCELLQVVNPVCSRHVTFPGMCGKLSDWLINRFQFNEEKEKEKSEKNIWFDKYYLHRTNLSRLKSFWSKEQIDQQICKTKSQIFITLKSLYAKNACESLVAYD